MKFTLGVVVLVQLFAQFLADPIAEQQSLPQCTDSQFAVTADNKLELYLDGHQVASGLPNADKWTVADSVSVPASTHVIAIKGINGDLIPVAGLLGSGAFSTTDGSWKCTNELQEGWAGKGFDDSNWPAATVLGSNGDHPWKTINGISSDAKWIWTEKQKYHIYPDKTVYCRHKRACRHEPPGTGPTCIRSCDGKTDGDYQSCKTCGGYASCSNGRFFDERPCAPSPVALVWDDNLKRCEWNSPTCTPLRTD